MKRLIVSLAASLGGLLFALPASSQDCAGNGHAVFPVDDGDPGAAEFEGSASTVGEIYTITWEHTAPGVTFTTEVADLVHCFTNGGLILVADGFGTGVLNGVGGYFYTIFLEDRRTPALPAVTLTASRTSPPTRFTDGEATFSPPRMVTIPATLEVTEGSPGNGRARLYLGDVRCDYQGNGVGYEFVACPGSEGLGPGDSFDVASAGLRVRSPGAHNADEPVITVEATIAPATPPGPGAPDIYSVTVFDAHGVILYDYGNNLNDDAEGDVVVTFLP
jgi:hypothetical protein